MNALCREACFEDETGRDRGRPITADAILAAQERLILRRDTHIDDLAHKLREERVRRVVEPILTGAAETACSDEDLSYVRDLGLVAQADGGPPRIANPIYAEVVPRHLNYAVQETLPQRMVWYVDADGELDVEGLITAFQEFFRDREHSEHWVQRFEQYHEAGPQLLLQAHLQRVVNGGGRIEREYALGRGRTDLLVVWPRGGASAVSRWSARCCARTWNEPSPRGWSRRAATWTAVRRRRATWSCSTARRTEPGRTRSSAARRRELACRSRSGECSAGTAPASSSRLPVAGREAGAVHLVSSSATGYRRFHGCRWRAA